MILEIIDRMTRSFNWAHAQLIPCLFAFGEPVFIHPASWVVFNRVFYKLVSVIKVVDLIDKDFVEREMVLVKVSATPETREEILRVADIFRGKVIDVGAKTYTIEVTGDEKKINALLALLKPLGIKELVRTGRVAMIRGSKITTEPP